MQFVARVSTSILCVSVAASSSASRSTCILIFIEGCDAKFLSALLRDRIRLSQTRERLKDLLTVQDISRREVGDEDVTDENLFTWRRRGRLHFGSRLHCTHKSSQPRICDTLQRMMRESQRDSCT